MHMKKVLLFTLMAAFTQLLIAQPSIDEGFEDVTVPDLPTGWTVIDNGDAELGTWETDAYSPHNGSQHVTLDCYADGFGAPDDYLITPQISLNEGDVLTFWSASWSSSFPDDIEVLASTTGTAEGDFTISVMPATTVPNSYTRYSVVLTDVSGLSSGDDIYLAFRCNSNGSGIDIDDVYVGEDLVAMFDMAYAVSDTELVVIYDKTIIQEDVDKTQFSLMGSETITFDTAWVDDTNDKMVHLWKGSSAMSSDDVIDTLIYAETQDTIRLYAGITSVEYTNITNPGDTLLHGEIASFAGYVTAVQQNKERVWIADAAGAYHGIEGYGSFEDIAIGDSVVLYGAYDPYENNSELYPSGIARKVSEGNTLFDPVIITPNDLDTAIAVDVDPAEKYENVLVKVENLRIDNFDDSGFDPYYYGSEPVKIDPPDIRIGDVNGIFEGTFGEGILNVGVSYDITGIALGKYGEWQISPRSVEDIVALDDATAPDVSNETQTINNTKFDTAKVQSTEAGYVYIILDGEAQSNLTEMDAAVAARKGSKAVAMPNTDADILVTDLAPGSYYAYAVDLGGNISAKGTNAITINSGAYSLPFVEDFEDSKLIPSDWKLVNGDGLDPDGTGWDALLDSAWIVIESTAFGGNAAMGVSYYSGDVSYANDWMILPKIMLGENSAISWEAMSLTTSGNFPDDYEVYVSTTTQDTAALKENGVIYAVDDESWSETADNAGDGIASHQIKLANEGFANQEVYIAFRLMTPHPGGDRLAVDNIVVSELDVTAPVVSNEAQTVVVGEDAYAQSNEPTGYIYMILDGEPQTTVAELDEAAASSAGTKVKVTAANTNMTLSTDGLIVGTYYAYAVDSALNKSAKGTNAITVEEATNVEEPEEDGITVYPNPVKNALYITNTTDIKRVVISNTIGQEVKTMILNKQEQAVIATDDLRSGIYFISFIDDKGTVKTSRFIKQ